MALEIERKFLVKPGFDIKSVAICKYEIQQSYLSDNPDCVVRLRIINNDAYITVKSRNEGAVRNEWEYALPKEDALQMIKQCKLESIIKSRYIVIWDERKWEIDVFNGKLSGLILAEVELSRADEDIELPYFVSEEVTHNEKYYNSNLLRSIRDER